METTELLETMVIIEAPSCSPSLPLTERNDDSTDKNTQTEEEEVEDANKNEMLDGWTEATTVALYYMHDLFSSSS